MMTRAVKSKAVDKKAGMTLGELSEFVIDAQHAGIDRDAKVEVRIGWNSQIQSLSTSSPVENS